MGEEQDKSTETLNQADEQQATDHLESVSFEDGEEVKTETDTPKDKETEADKADADEDAGLSDQEKVNKRFNKLTFEKHEALREKEAAEARAAEAERKLAEATKKSGEIVIPPMPDAFDPEYETKIKARDDAIAAKTKADAQAELAASEQQRTAAVAQEKINKEIQDNTSRMYKKAEEYKISPADLDAAEKVVVNYLPGPDVARFILQQEDSALIVKYLSNNAEQLAKIRSMGPIDAAVYISNNIAAEAAKLKPTSPGTSPEPLDIPTGKGGGSNNPWLEGVQIE